MWPSNAAALTEDAERQLHDALRDAARPGARTRSPSAAMRRVSRRWWRCERRWTNFFERIMVMDEDVGRRNNRLALLRDVQLLLGGVADLSRLPG